MTLKPLVTTGIAIVGASVIAVSPLAPPPGPVGTGSPDVHLTAVVPDEIRTFVAGLGLGFGTMGGPLVALALSPPVLALLPGYLISQGVPPDEAFAAVAGIVLAAPTAVFLAPVAGFLIGVPPPLGGPTGIGVQIITPAVQFISDLGTRLIGDVGPYLPSTSFPLPEGPLRDLTDPIYQIQQGFIFTVDGLSKLLGATPEAVIDGIDAISEGADPGEVVRSLAYRGVAGIFGDPDAEPISYGALAPLNRALVMNLPDPLGGAVNDARVAFDQTVVAPIRNALRPTTGLAVANKVPEPNNLVTVDVVKESPKRPLLNLLRNSTKATPGGGAAATGRVDRPGQRVRATVNHVTQGISDSVDRVSNAIKKVTNRNADQAE